VAVIAGLTILLHSLRALTGPVEAVQWAKQLIDGHDLEELPGCARRDAAEVTNITGMAKANCNYAPGFLTPNPPCCTRALPPRWEKVARRPSGFRRIADDRSVHWRGRPIALQQARRLVCAYYSHIYFPGVPAQ
jgi:hypothetical protein